MSSQYIVFVLRHFDMYGCTKLSHVYKPTHTYSGGETLPKPAGSWQKLAAVFVQGCCLSATPTRTSQRSSRAAMIYRLQKLEMLAALYY